jgi:hypothetical protein
MLRDYGLSEQRLYYYRPARGLRANSRNGHSPRPIFVREDTQEGKEQHTLPHNCANESGVSANPPPGALMVDYLLIGAITAILNELDYTHRSFRILLFLSVYTRTFSMLSLCLLLSEKLKCFHYCRNGVATNLANLTLG